VNSLPSVSITAPTNGSAFTAPASIAIGANAADSDGSVSKVDFYQGTTLIGTVTAAPFNFNWTNVAGGSYSLTAKATDDRGAITTSSAVNVTVNNPAPTVSITAPNSGTVVNAPANVSINASASVAAGTISKVDFYQGATLIGTVTAAPFNFNWTNVSAGSYSLTAKATASTGTTTTSAAVNVTVNSPPSVSITAPTTGSTFTAPATVAINTNAADSDGTVSKVDFYQGTTLIGTITAAPFNFNWTNVAGGSYSLTAKATDNRGAITTSGAVNVTVNNPAPIVSITFPANGIVVNAPASIAINASASVAAGTISKVDFYQATTLIGTITTAPFMFNWTNVSAGSYSLTAKATASTGTTATSAAINVSVINPPGGSNVQDSFTSSDGVELSLHVGEVGATWTQPSYAHNSKDYIYGNRVTHEANSSRNIYYASALPPSDCYVQATITKLGLATATAGLVLRLDPASENYYYATYDTSTSLWAIFSSVNGTNTQLGSWPDAIFYGQARVVKFQAIGNNLTLLIDGTSRVSVTNADHPGPGRVGLVMSGVTSQYAGFAISNFEAGATTVGSTFATRTMDSAKLALIDLVLKTLRGLS
jgi:hypothetical protein